MYNNSNGNNSSSSTQTKGGVRLRQREGLNRKLAQAILPTEQKRTEDVMSSYIPEGSLDPVHKNPVLNPLQGKIGMFIKLRL